MPEHQQTQQPKITDNTSQKQTITPKQTPTSHPVAIIQRARINPKSLTHADVMQLQRTIGNRAVGKLLTEIRKPSSRVQMQQMPEKEEDPIQGSFKSEARQTLETGLQKDVVQRKVFLFSGISSPPGSALHEGAEWFTHKDARLAPSDERFYIEGIESTFPAHVKFDVLIGGGDYNLEPGETAIIVAHGKLGGGLESFASDDSKAFNEAFVTQKVLETVRKIIEINLNKPAFPPIRIFVAACNSARNVIDLSGVLGSSPIQYIIETLKLQEYVHKGRVILEGYTAQAALYTYDKSVVDPEREGKHIYGINKVTPTGKILDTSGSGQKLFGYDTAITARAYVDTIGKVGFSSQSQPLGNPNMPWTEFKSLGLKDRMSRTKP